MVQGELLLSNPLFIIPFSKTGSKIETFPDHGCSRFSWSEKSAFLQTHALISPSSGNPSGWQWLSSLWLNGQFPLQAGGCCGKPRMEFRSKPCSQVQLDQKYNSHLSGFWAHSPSILEPKEGRVWLRSIGIPVSSPCQLFTTVPADRRLCTKERTPEAQ